VRRASSGATRAANFVVVRLLLRTARAGSWRPARGHARGVYFVYLMVRTTVEEEKRRWIEELRAAQDDVCRLIHKTKDESEAPAAVVRRSKRSTAEW